MLQGAMTTPDSLIREVLTRTRTIALVGFSANPARPSNSVSRFLQSRGYRVIPVNPGLAGQSHHGETVYARLSEIPSGIQVDMVEVFRRSEEVAALVDEVLTAMPGVKTIWTQLGVRDDTAAAKARDAGLTVIQNRCPAIEIPRLIG